MVDRGDLEFVGKTRAWDAKLCKILLIENKTFSYSFGNRIDAFMLFLYRIFSTSFQKDYRTEWNNGELKNSGGFGEKTGSRNFSRKTGSSLPSLNSAMFPGQHRLVVDRQNSIWREEISFENSLKSSPNKVGLPTSFYAKRFFVFTCSRRCRYLA